MGTWFSDKYAEGTVGHRFYAGCQNVDTVEALAAEHARELFGAPYAYAQPHSGIDANLVAFWSILAHRVEGPWLEKAGAKNVNELTEADWESLRHELGNQRLLGMSPRRRRPPHPRLPAQHQRQDVPPAAVRHRPGDRAARLRRGRGQGPRVQAAGAGGRLLGVPAPGELRQDARDRRRGRRDADGRHGPLRRPGRRQGLHRRRGPGAARPHHHDHDAQVAARPARRPGAGDQEEFAAVGRPRLPDGPRRSALAHDGRQGGRARRGPAGLVPAPTPRTIADNAKSLAEGFLTRGAKLVTGGTDNHIVLLDVSSFGLTGRQAESALLDAGVVTNRNSVPPTPTAPGTPPASASAPRRSPPAASATTSSTRSPS